MLRLLLKYFINQFLFLKVTTPCSTSTTTPVPSAPCPCQSNPCQNGGTCIPMSTTSYVCNCCYPYTGTYCQNILIANPCASSPWFTK